MIEIIKPDNIPSKPGIYKFSLNTGHFYFGSSQNIKHRIGGHIRNFRPINQKRLNRHLKKHILMATSITFYVLEVIANSQERKQKEEQYLKSHKSDPLILNYKKWVFPIKRKSKQLSSSVSEEKISKIRILAKEKEVSISTMVDILLEEALNNRVISSEPGSKELKSKKKSA